jgi:hypothetical protein
MEPRRVLLRDINPLFEKPSVVPCGFSHFYLIPFCAFCAFLRLFICGGSLPVSFL